MRDIRWLVLLLGAMAGASLLGCQPPPPPPPPAVVIPPVLSFDQYRAVKAEYLRANPQASVGRVAAVLPEDSRLSANDLKTGDFARGDVVTIVDRDLNPVADGVVVDVDRDYVYVKYSAPVEGGGRTPLVGDILIRPGKPDRATYR